MDIFLIRQALGTNDAPALRVDRGIFGGRRLSAGRGDEGLHQYDPDWAPEPAELSVLYWGTGRHHMAGGALPWHTRVQVINTSIPLTAPDTWDFTELDSMFAPVQGTGDHSPEFQIGTAPAFLSDSNDYILPASYGAFAQMSAELVRYYNSGGSPTRATYTKARRRTR